MRCYGQNLDVGVAYHLGNPVRLSLATRIAPEVRFVFGGSSRLFQYQEHQWRALRDISDGFLQYHSSEVYTLKMLVMVYPQYVWQVLVMGLRFSIACRRMYEEADSWRAT